MRHYSFRVKSAHARARSRYRYPKNPTEEQIGKCLFPVPEPEPEVPELEPEVPESEPQPMLLETAVSEVPVSVPQVLEPVVQEVHESEVLVPQVPHVAEVPEPIPRAQILLQDKPGSVVGQPRIDTRRGRARHTARIKNADLVSHVKYELPYLRINMC